MKPIYFPFTYITEKIAYIIKEWFGEAIIYQAIKSSIPDKLIEYSNKYNIDIRTPIETSDTQVLSIYKEYLKLGETHNISDLKQLKVTYNNPPFFDDLSSFKIRSEIKGNTKQESPKDPILNARIFLHMAQQLDIQNAEIEDSITSLTNIEYKIFNSIKDELDDSIETHKNLISNKSDSYKIKERISAWTYLFEKDQKTIFPLFITTQPVIDHLIDKNININKLFSCCFNSESSGNILDQYKNILQKHILVLLKDNIDNIQAGTNQLFNIQKSDTYIDIYVANQSPVSCLEQYIDRTICQNEVNNNISNMLNTIFIVVSTSK